MKDYLLNRSINIVNKKYNYDEEKIEILKYGLEGLYLTITKFIVISILCTFLNIFKEMICLLLFFNIIRSFSYGLHAKTSLACLVSSIIVFIFCPIICKSIIIKYDIKLIIGILLIILITLFSPSDTEKRPIVSKKRRKHLKLISFTISVVFVIVGLLIKNEFISNCLFMSLAIESVLINPLSYKLFGLSYNNYKTYNQDKKEV